MVSELPGQGLLGNLPQIFVYFAKMLLVWVQIDTTVRAIILLLLSCVLKMTARRPDIDIFPDLTGYCTLSIW